MITKSELKEKLEEFIAKHEDEEYENKTIKDFILEAIKDKIEKWEKGE